MKVFEYCICTITTQKSIDALLEGGGAGTYKDDQPWLVAKEFLDRASGDGCHLPILLATEEAMQISHWSMIKRIDVMQMHDHRWQTACDFDVLQPTNPIWSELDSVSLKAADEQLRREALEGVRTHRWQLDAQHIRPYAICETPPFILALGEAD